ncbi:MAG: hypothetical protein ACM34I_12470 [bacterium]
MEKFTSVSVRRFKLAGVLFVLCLFSVQSVRAVVIDRVVAFVDDLAITQSDLMGKYGELRKINEEITYQGTLETMINRILLLNEAKRYRMESETDDGLIEQYIDLKIRAAIRIAEKDIRKYFEDNQEHFRNKAYDDVRDDILKFLTEKEVNERLRRQIEQLRENSRVIINVDFSSSESGIRSP